MKGDPIPAGARPISPLENRVQELLIGSKIESSLINEGILDGLKSPDKSRRKKILESLKDHGAFKESTLFDELLQLSEAEPDAGGAEKSELRPVAHRGEAGYERLVAVVDDPNVPKDIKRIAEKILNSNFPGHKEAEKEFDGFSEVKEWHAQEKAEKAAGQEKGLKDLGETAAGELTKKDEIEKALAAAGVSPEQREKMLAALQTPEAKAGLAAKISQTLKNWVPNGWQEFLAGFGAGYGTKLVIRSAITAVYGSSLGVAVAGGAVAGGIFGGAWRGGKVWWQERKKVSGRSVLDHLSEIAGFGEEEVVNCDWKKRVGIYAKVKEVYDKALVTGDPQEVEEIGKSLRAAKVLMERDGNAGLRSLPPKDRFLSILKLADDANAEIPLMTEREYFKQLLSELKEDVKFKRGKVDWIRVAKAAGRGALIGAVGGALGGAFASWMHGGAEGAAVHGGGGAPGEQVPMPGGGGAGAVPLEAGAASADVAGGYMPPGESGPPYTELPHAAAADALPPEALADRVVEIHNVYEEAMAPAREALLNHDFIATVHPGDGPTHAARNLLHDFLVNQHHLNPGAPTLSPEQLVWAEDTIYKNLLPNEDFYKLGHPPIHLSGDKLADVYSRALQLTPEKIQNLHQFVSGGRLSEKTLDYFADFKDLKEAGNNFWAGVQEQAEAAQKAYLEHVQSTWADYAHAAETAPLTPEEQLANLPPDYHPPGSMPGVADQISGVGETSVPLEEQVAGIGETQIPVPGAEQIGMTEIPADQVVGIGQTTIPVPGAENVPLAETAITPETGILNRVFGGETTGEGIERALTTLAVGVVGGAVAVGGFYGYKWMRKVGKIEKEQKEDGDKREKTLTAEERLAEIKETFKNNPELGDIYERASREGARFGEELTLNDEEKKKINTLMEDVMGNWKRYLQSAIKEANLESEWDFFVDLLAGNRVGITDDEKEKLKKGDFKLTGDPNAKDVSYDTDEDGNLTLVVPDKIEKLYMECVGADASMKDLTDCMDDYDKKVSSKGNALFFADTLRHLHALNEKFKV